MLSHDPGDGSTLPNVTKVMFRSKPQTCEIQYFTPEQLNRMMLLAAVLGCEIDYVEEPPENKVNIESGIIAINHDGRFDIEQIAIGADISSPDLEMEKEWERID